MILLKYVYKCTTYKYSLEQRTKTVQR